MTNKVYSEITNAIIEKIKEGVNPWQRPFASSGTPTNYISKKAYRGINVLLLSLFGRGGTYFVTFKQAKGLGGKVKKGAKGIPVIFYKPLFNLDGKTVSVETAQAAKRQGKTISVFPMIKKYYVWPVEDVEGVEFDIPKIEGLTPQQKVDAAEKVIQDYLLKDGPKITRNTDGAYYQSRIDNVNIQPLNYFENISGYYSTWFHELAHSTGHENRLNRPGIIEKASFGSERYSKEELIAEITASFLCSDCDIVPPLDNSAAYLKSWMKAIGDDPKLIVTAANAAQKAADWILGKR